MHSVCVGRWIWMQAGDQLPSPSSESSFLFAKLEKGAGDSGELRQQAPTGWAELALAGSRRAAPPTARWERPPVRARRAAGRNSPATSGVQAALLRAGRLFERRDQHGDTG